MTTSIVLYDAAGVDIPIFEPKAWRDDVMRRHLAGERIVTIYGRPHTCDVMITSVFRDLGGRVEATRTLVDKRAGYHEMTSDWLATHCFERELFEQTGLRIASHPWLKPIRSPSSGPAMESYSYYHMDGKELHEVAVGPVHAGVIEPGSFRFICLGEQVQHLEIQLGYQHRGVEEQLLRGNPSRLSALVETIAGDSSVAHAWAYCAAIESLGRCEVPLATECGRAFALELERVAMHLGTLAGLAGDIGFLQGLTTYGRLRTTAINTSMSLCGSRFGRGAIRPGTVNMLVGGDLLGEVAANLRLMVRDLSIINDCVLSARTVQHRMIGVGVLGKVEATDLGLVGLVARASGVCIDARMQMDTQAGVFGVIPMRTVTSPGGDCWARMLNRMEEIKVSLAWLVTILAEGYLQAAPRLVLKPLEPQRLAVTMVEGFRGEVVHCVETDADGGLQHYKVQDPSFRNWMGLALAMRGNEISDFPICNKSFDLSYCGNDL